MNKEITRRTYLHIMLAFVIAVFVAPITSFIKLFNPDTVINLSNLGIVPSKCHHISMTKDGSVIRIYVDGLLCVTKDLWSKIRVVRDEQAIITFNSRIMGPDSSLRFWVKFIDDKNLYLNELLIV